MDAACHSFLARSVEVTKSLEPFHSVSGFDIFVGVIGAVWCHTRQVDDEIPNASSLMGVGRFLVNVV